MAIGTIEIAILVIFGIIVFGAKRIPELARSVGLAKGEFQKAVEEGVQPSSAEQDMDRGGMTEEVSNENE
ncbi:twin-arginine translocase TatA/TatE family subunit [Candidatus Thalassarchaeum betae]|jgi:sec-independent protein translocase protein TatA|nr:twin-arginine translocase TatA/TatE family subunit [Candidatus Thalassoarchaea betae]